jgi:hypothetical protein
MESLDSPSELLGGTRRIDVDSLGGKKCREQAQKTDEDRSRFHELSIEKSGVRIYRMLPACVELDLPPDAEIQDSLYVVSIDDRQFSSLSNRHGRKSNAINLHKLTPVIIFD